MSAVSSRSKGGVVLAPGLWFGRPALWGLAYRLTRRGFRVFLYPYDSLGQGLPVASEDLAKFVAACGARYLVGYSLGGVLVCSFCQRYPAAYTRAVVLGPPFRGSRVARRLWRCRPFRRFFGAAAPVLLRGWRGVAPLRLGVVTGTMPWGIAGLWLQKGTHDGVLAAAETRLRGASDAVALRVSHGGLVLSAQSGRAIAQYLEEGHFGN
ncbi:MAG: esterase/lipase family protein [Acidiferrobacter sp.]